MAGELERIEGPSYEEVLAGDFVHLASGSPLGLVEVVENGVATVVWFNDDLDHSILPWLCLRPAR